VRRLLERAARLDVPAKCRRALDVGCGVGRHARPLAREFGGYLGLDVSAPMVERAVRLHAETPGASFRVGDAVALDDLPAQAFDLVQCWLVLIHLPDRQAVLEAVGGLGRALAPGGLLAFQFVTAVAPRNRLRGRRRAYRALRRLGMPAKTLVGRMGLNPIRMTAVGAREVEEGLREEGLSVLESEDSESLGSGISSRVLYATRTAYP